MTPAQTFCPKCGKPVEDLDGFGVLIHDECGYCSHPDVYGDVCRACGTGVVTPPAPAANT